jgi:hypothetical protein
MRERIRDWGGEEGRGSGVGRYCWSEMLEEADVRRGQALMRRELFV